MVEFCSSSATACPSATKMKFSIKSTFKNPSYITDPTTSMTVSTMTSNEKGQIDTIATGVVVTPSLTPNDLTDLKISYQSIASSATSYVYSNADRYELEFSPFPYMRANGGKVKFSMPKGAMILMSSSSKP
jgi:hypothetical protein